MTFHTHIKEKGYCNYANLVLISYSIDVMGWSLICDFHEKSYVKIASKYRGANKF